MGKRKLPFGYQLKQGDVTIHEAEATVVHEIFEKYVSGASYLEITRMLKNQPVTYQPDKLWNKNMIARILENVCYIGENGFPPIIEKDVFQRAAEKRSGRQGSPRNTAAQKTLSRLCKGISPEKAEPRVLAALNRLIAIPQLIQPPEVQPSENPQVAVLHQQLDVVMEQQPIDEDTASVLIMQLASARYNAIGSGEYETERLRRYFEMKTPMTELDTEILREAVSNVTTCGKKAIITLQNGQVMEME